MGNESISKAAIAGQTTAQRDALMSVDNAVNKSIGGISDANKALRDTAYDVLNFRSDETFAALDFAGTSQKQVNDLIRYTNEQFTNKLASNAGDAPQETVQNIVKYVATAAVVGVLAIGAIYAWRKAA